MKKIICISFLLFVFLDLFATGKTLLKGESRDTIIKEFGGRKVILKDVFKFWGKDSSVYDPIGVEVLLNINGIIILGQFKDIYYFVNDSYAGILSEIYLSSYKDWKNFLTESFGEPKVNVQGGDA